MNTFKFKFIGSQAGAIGITYPILETYKATGINQAMSLLYEDYEHISALIIKENGKQIPEPKDIHWETVRSNRERTRKSDNATYA